MADVILIVVLLGILGGASFYIYKSKKQGNKCIGCPSGANCKMRENGRCNLK